MELTGLTEKWREQGETLITYSAGALTNTHLTEATRTFLTSCGLPESAAPFLEFMAPQETLPTVPQYYRIEWDGLNEYLVIGYNGSGDPICIDVETGNEIVYLNHDRSFERVRINATIEQFSRSLLAYKLFHASLVNLADLDDFSLRKFSDTEFTQLQSEFREIDSKALDIGTFWKMELDGLLWERDQ
jgi:hypothetical protein